MSHRYDRGVKKHIRLLNINSELLVPASSALDSLKVQSITRVPDKEYPDTLTAGTSIIHFGLPVYDIDPQSVTVLARILENGYFRANKEEVLPLLSFNNTWIAKIDRVINCLPYDEIPRDYFKNTIGEIKNSKQLKKIILDRYSKCLPDLSDDQILSQGVSIRFLKLIKQVSFPENRL